MKIRYCFFIFAFLFCFQSGAAMAREVQVFLPIQEDVSPMELRQQALTQGFAEAVLMEARVMLPAELDESRSDLFKEYLLTRVEPYIQGYKVVSSQSTEDGVILDLDVRINKKPLREGLKNMGLFSTVMAPLVANVEWAADISEENLVKLRGLMTLTGIRNTQGVLPSLKIENGPEGTFKGSLFSEKKEWAYINKDLSVVWFNLWGKYFHQSQQSQPLRATRKLSVAGWFSPDAALEFDRVLKGWDSAVQDVSLAELNLQPSGVGGTWELRLLDDQRLEMLLQAYLPQRGVTYQLSGD
ncbi:hypothetical protein [Pseudodesulfovibrio piezophilus]|uniref:hypothetical protein n=1 Tax=Pseudodesulfovibrio piezophilus TaxID=879567 RepID=UPI00138ABDAC|nr:hypothetical protein [Pseudodesulfovibrio piezophilus]